VVRRRWTLLDAMLLIAALAVAIAWTRALVPIIRERGDMDSPMWARMPWQSRLIWWPPAATPGLMMGSLFLVYLSARPPRPPWREITQRPGAVVGGAALAAFIVQLALVVLGKILGQVPGMVRPGPGSAMDQEFLIWRLATDLSGIVGYVVMGAWLTLALGRRWAAESSWSDRAGRLLGACWLTLVVAQRVAIYIRS
jgi:hypothetical protein